MEDDRVTSGPAGLSAVASVTGGSLPARFGVFFFGFFGSTVFVAAVAALRPALVPPVRFFAPVVVDLAVEVLVLAVFFSVVAVVAFPAVFFVVFFAVFFAAFFAVFFVDVLAAFFPVAVFPVERSVAPVFLDVGDFFFAAAVLPSCVLLEARALDVFLAVDVPLVEEADDAAFSPLFELGFSVVFFLDSTEVDDVLRGRVANSHPREQKIFFAPA